MSKKPATPPIREATLKRMLRCTFTQPEILELSKTLAEKTNTIATLEDEKSRASKDYSARIATVANLVNETARKVTNGYEFRDVDVRVQYDLPKPGKKTITRLDKNSLVGIEDMSFEEKQTVIPEVEEAAAKAKKEADAKAPPALAKPPTKKRRTSPGVVAVAADGKGLGAAVGEV